MKKVANKVAMSATNLAAKLRKLLTFSYHTFALEIFKVFPVQHSTKHKHLVIGDVYCGREF